MGTTGPKPRPAPSRTDFMSDLFGDADENAAPSVGQTVNPPVRPTITSSRSLGIPSPRSRRRRLRLSAWA